MGGTIGSRIRLAAGCVAAAAAVAAVAPLPAVAVPGPHGPMLGAVQAKRGPALRPRMAPLAPGGPLTYHGGPVVHDGHVYAIFWEPAGFAFPADYKGAVARYFADAAADSGKRSNVYSTVTQYRDAIGPAAYQVAFARSYTDTSAFPASGCTYPATPVCLTDDQLTGALNSFISSHGLPRGLSRQYFLFTPPGVGTCYDGSGQAPCALHDFCAYHSWFGGASTVLYAVHPYVRGAQACDPGQSPTGTSADAVLNVASHEHAEILTDPTGDGWYDQNQDENGDKCAWTFGTLQGSAGARFNQVIAGRRYLLQQEWSNRDDGCKGSSVNQIPLVAFEHVGQVVAGQTAFFTAGASRDPDGTIASYAWSFGDGRAGTGVSPVHTFSKAGTYPVKLTVTDNEGATASRTLGVVVAKRFDGNAPAVHKHRKHRKHRKKRKHGRATALYRWTRG